MAHERRPVRYGRKQEEAREEVSGDEVGFIKNYRVAAENQSGNDQVRELTVQSVAHGQRQGRAEHRTPQQRARGGVPRERLRDEEEDGVVHRREVADRERAVGADIDPKAGEAEQNPDAEGDVERIAVEGGRAVERGADEDGGRAAQQRGLRGQQRHLA